MVTDLQSTSTVTNWLEIIKDIHEMERLTFLLSLRKDLYCARWTKWTMFLLNEEGN